MQENLEATELASLVGRNCNWIVPSRGNPGAGNIMVLCQIKSARTSFGRQEVKIEPVEGSGFRWVQMDQVEIL